MHPALWISKTGLDAQQTNINVISQNLANVNTTGYKRGRAVFEDLLYQTIQQPGAQSSQITELPTGIMMGTGVRTSAVQKIFTKGGVLQTDNPLDIQVNGRGFFQVLMPDGTNAFTRDGTFQLNGEGQIVTASGYQLQPAMTIPQGTKSITVGNDGTVSVLIAGNPNPQQLGVLQIADFTNEAGLEPIGENLFRETVASGAPIVGNPGLQGLGTLMQGRLESSNVNVVEELVNMIETQRAYEMNSKSIETVDKMLQYVNQTL